VGRLWWHLVESVDVVRNTHLVVSVLAIPGGDGGDDNMAEVEVMITGRGGGDVVPTCSPGRARSAQTR
jgi:hypothetical protein